MRKFEFEFEKANGSISTEESIIDSQIELYQFPCP
jgi:hypothetical protein